MTKREDQARDYAAEQWRYVKVYGAEGDSLRLTDAEREAVEWCVEMAVLHATDCDDEIAALRSLLERTK